MTAILQLLIQHTRNIIFLLSDTYGIISTKV